MPRENLEVLTKAYSSRFLSRLKVFFLIWFWHPVKRRLAKYYLRLLQLVFKLEVIAITGSAGKTTVKEMLVAILRQKGETAGSKENIDPVYNIPAAILRCCFSTRYLVLEMGVEYAKDMDFYLWLAKPAIGVVTNIYPTHLLYLKSVKRVAFEKRKLVKSLPATGLAILNRENKIVRGFAKGLKAKVLFFGKGSRIQVFKTKITTDWRTRMVLEVDKKRILVCLPVVGEEFVQNALAAAAAGYALGASLDQIKKGLETYQLSPHRMRVFQSKNQGLIVDDSYNNNPAAVLGALKTFADLAGKKEKIVVLGDMLELGRREEKYHRRVGRKLADFGVKYVIGVGPASVNLIKEARVKLNPEDCFWVSRVEEVFPVLIPLLNRETAVLIKGSRAIGLDRLISGLRS